MLPLPTLDSTHISPPFLVINSLQIIQKEQSEFTFTTISITSPENIYIHSKDNIIVKVYPDSLEKQVTRLRKLWGEIKKHQGINFVDLRFTNKIIVNHKI